MDMQKTVLERMRFTRRTWLGSAFTGVGAATSALALAPAAVAQQACPEATPTEGFGGKIGRVGADSEPSPLPVSKAPAGSPNIVYILLDDTGYADLHCYGSEAATPHIDALARQGLLYNNFQSKAICSPTRASLLTGRNNHAVGMRELATLDLGYPHSRGRITPAAATVAQILQANGYSTYGVGKWHLVPRADMNPAGSREHWPLQKGFDRWYGFLSGWTDQYAPDLVEDNRPISRPAEAGYHFSEDIVHQSRRMLDSHLEHAPEKPFFHYIAFGATHAPVQVPREYIDKYVDTYSKGWDAIREQRYRKQLEMGIIPAGTKLPPRNPGDPAWDELSAEERTVFTRFMAAYAGFMEHTDAQIGRFVDYLKEKGLFENTVIFLLSDNGGAPEAGNKGGFVRPYGDPMPVADMLPRIEEMGLPGTQPLYQRAWAMASVAPFKYYKLWPYGGGVQTPFVVSWPKGINRPGLRRQFVDMIDITPTALDIAGVDVPASFRGICQIPLHGESIRATFENPDSPDPRDTQYFELWGSRAIYHQGWKAIAIHRPGSNFDEDTWELYHVAEDFSESNDLAAAQPERLERMKKLWWDEAAKYGALPLLEASTGRGRTYDQALEP